MNRVLPLLILTMTFTPILAGETGEPPVIVAGPDGFGIRSEDGAYDLRLRSLVQVDGRGFFDDHTEGNDEFLVRRARIELTGTLARQFAFRIMPDFAGSGTTLLDAWLRWAPTPTVQVQFGKVKMPIGLEREQSREHNLFVEFGYPTALVPNRDIGIGILGRVANNRLEYYAGGSNGTTDGGSVTGDDNDGKTLNWRLLAMPLPAANGRGELAVGVAGTYGEMEGGSPSGYQTVGQQVFFAWRPAGATSTGVRLDGTARRIAPQLYYYRGSLGILGEYVQSSQELSIDGIRETIENSAYQVGVSYVLTGEAATFRGVKPERPVGEEAGGRGAWQVVARYTELDVDGDAFPILADPAAAAGRASTWTAGLNWYGTKQVRISINYSHTTLDSETPGTSFDDEKAIVVRSQFRF